MGLSSCLFELAVAYALAVRPKSGSTNIKLLDCFIRLLHHKTSDGMFRFHIIVVAPPQLAQSTISIPICLGD